MDYPLAFRKFVTSQYLYSGIRTTAAVLIPAIILYEYDVLATMISIPLGAMITSLADNPGPPQHRRNAMLVSLGLNLMLIIISGFTKHSPLLIGIELIVFGLLLSLIGIFGARANGIGLTSLILFTLSLDPKHGLQNIAYQAAFFLTGGLWYMLLSTVLYQIRPYLPVQQLLGECLMETAQYLRTRAELYKPGINFPDVYARLFTQQVAIHKHHQDLREMILATRRFINESTNKSRGIMMLFLDSVDLLESIMTAQHEYDQLQKDFGDTHILKIFAGNVELLADTVHQIGLSLQEGMGIRINRELLEARFLESNEAFEALRSAQLRKRGNVEAFIRLRHILHRLQDLTQRVKRLSLYAAFDKEMLKEKRPDVDLQQFRPHQEINLDLFRSNFTLKSSAFRNSIRQAIALLIGYLVSFFFELGHGYWILLTIATIMRPAFSLAKERNINRLLGTLAGAVAGFGLLFLTNDNTVLFSIMILSMIIGYGAIKINYGLGIAGITIYLLVSFHYLDPFGLQEVLQDRIIDTVIGSVIAYLVSLLVLPNWEREQINMEISNTLTSNRNYFEAAARFFRGNAPEQTEYKIARKEAFVALANLSDLLQRMISEPKSKRQNLELYHQLVTATHMLTSHIAGLAHYGKSLGSHYQQQEFEPMIKIILRQFKKALRIQDPDDPETVAPDSSIPINKKVLKLLEQRKLELESGQFSMARETRQTMTDLKIITDQFRLISSTLGDEIKILSKLYGNGQPGHPAEQHPITMDKVAG